MLLPPFFQCHNMENVKFFRNVTLLFHDISQSGAVLPNTTTCDDPLVPTTCVRDLPSSSLTVPRPVPNPAPGGLNAGMSRRVSSETFFHQFKVVFHFTALLFNTSAVSDNSIPLFSISAKLV